METIEPKALNKGDWVQLKNGWLAEVKSKAKGIRIFLLVHGDYSEMGDVYTRDLRRKIAPVSPEQLAALKAGDTISVQPLALIKPNDKHAKQFEKISALGF